MINRLEVRGGGREHQARPHAHTHTRTHLSKARRIASTVGGSLTGHTRCSIPSSPATKDVSGAVEVVTRRTISSSASLGLYMMNTGPTLAFCIVVERNGAGDDESSAYRLPSKGRTGTRIALAEAACFTHLGVG